MTTVHNRLPCMPVLTATFGFRQQQALKGKVVRAAKIPKLDTVPVMLNKPCQHIDAPSKSFRCPLCLETVGPQSLSRSFVQRTSGCEATFLCLSAQQRHDPGMHMVTHHTRQKLHFVCTVSVPAVLSDHFGPSVTTFAPPEAQESSDTADLSSTCYPTSGRPDRQCPVHAS